MPITDYQKKTRSKAIGSSDMAAVLGVDPYRSPYDVWLEKTGRLEELQENHAMMIGNTLENGVLDFAESELGKLRRNQRRVCEDAPLAANIDAIVVADQLPVEAKTSGILGPLDREWGEAGTDEVPYRFIVQCHVAMLCLNRATKAFLPALLGGRGLCMFVIEADADLSNIILDRAGQFWDKHVAADTPPSDSVPTMDVLARRKRDPQMIVSLDPMLLQSWRSAFEARKVAEQAEDEIKRQIIAALGDAEAGDVGDGLITYFQQSRSNVDTKRLKQAFPEAYKEVRTESVYRVLRHKPHKD